MTEASPSRPEEDFFKRFFSKLEFSWTAFLVVILAPLLLVLSSTLCGYWNTLGIDVFSYLTFSSLVLDGFTNVLLVLLFLGLISIIPPFLSASMLSQRKILERMLPWLKSNIGVCVIISAYLGFISLGAFTYCGFTETTMGALGCAIILGGFTGYVVLQKHLDNLRLHTLAFALFPSVVAFLMFAYAHGAKRAEDYLSTPVQHAMLGGDAAWSPVNTEALMPGSNVKFFTERYLPVIEVKAGSLILKKNYFLGRIGNYYFFLDANTKKREAIREEKIERLTFLNSPSQRTPIVMPWSDPYKRP